MRARVRMAMDATSVAMHYISGHQADGSERCHVVRPSLGVRLAARPPRPLTSATSIGPMNHASDAHAQASLNRAAFSATTHCLTGCAIGEVLGMVVATALGWGNTASIAISIVLPSSSGMR